MAKLYYKSMSYDLYFCRKKKERILTYSELTEWISKYNFFTETEWDDAINNKTKLINYENPNTGVYFQLEYGTYDDEWADWENKSEFSEYTKPNLYMRLNVPRPTFFAIETASITSHMCKDLRLFVVDGQASGLPEPFSIKDMIESWMDTNAFAAQIIGQKKMDYIYWPESEATDVWEYNFYAPEGLKTYPNAIAANIEGVVKTGGKKIRLMTRWLKGEEMILPKTYYVTLFDPDRATKVILHSEVMKALGSLAEPIASRREGTIIIKKQNVKKTDEVFEYLMKHAKAMSIQTPACTVMDRDIGRYNVGKIISIIAACLVFFLVVNTIQRVGSMKLIEKSRAAWVMNDAENIVKYAQFAKNIAIYDYQKSQAWYWLGVGKYRMGEFDEAIKWELKAREMNPSDAGPIITLGGAFLGKNDFEAALEYGKSAVAMKPGSEWAHNLLGLAYWATGNIEEATRELYQATQINPGQSVIAENYRRITGGR